MTKKTKTSVYPDNEITVAELARREGVTRQTAHGWKKDGRLVLTNDGKRAKYKESAERLKKTKSLNGWANEQHAKKERAEINDRIEKEKSFTELKDSVSETQLDLETDNADDLFKNSRALREKAAALQAAAEHEHYISQMVKREVIGRAIFDILRALRDNMTAIGRRISVDVAVTDNAAECEKIISNQINEALQRVTKELKGGINESKGYKIFH